MPAFHSKTGVIQCRSCKRSLPDDEYREAKRIELRPNCIDCEYLLGNLKLRMVFRDRFNVRRKTKRFGPPAPWPQKVCEICAVSISHGSDLVYDHCHVTGLNRGVLCRKCNQGIGLLKDDYELVGRALDYLNRYRSQHLNYVKSGERQAQ